MARSGRTRPKHHFFRETRIWCSEGSWERISQSPSAQTPPSFSLCSSKFTAARYTATPPRRPARLLPSVLCALALQQGVLMIETEEPRQYCPMITTAGNVLPAFPATPIASVRNPAEVVCRQSTLGPP